MFITNTLTKKMLEKMIQETFSHFGNLSSSSLLDSLKLLGFHYATNSGISINIEDLKTPEVKKVFIEIAEKTMDEVSNQWDQGYLSDIERFQSIIDSWNNASESLKTKIVEYYKYFNPTNNLYIMAFSGARGNLSQVRQLIGMRGLMSDQEGKIIDLPIRANFREGLSSIDYIISSYGARKGIVDTALKTADSGYLTRRLIYLAQDLIVRELNCESKTGIIVLLDKHTSTNNLLGHLLISIYSNKFPYEEIYPISIKNKLNQSNSISLKSFSKTKKNKLESHVALFDYVVLNEEKLKNLKDIAPVSLIIRSPLTCISTSSICQYCYGWDLAHKSIVSLGQAVGIIGAQSIGEPGTQLTMRTFHTGGIFTSETVQQFFAPFSGMIYIPESLKTVSYRTTQGHSVLKIRQEITITLKNWKGEAINIFLKIGSFIYISSLFSFIRKNQLICEYPNQSTIIGSRRLKPIYSRITGEIKFQNISLQKTNLEKKTVKITNQDGTIWVAAGKILPFSSEIKYQFIDQFQKKIPIGLIKVVTPISGIFEKTLKTISIWNKHNKLVFNFDKLHRIYENSLVQFCIIPRNYQYIDSYTILAFFYIFPNYKGKIYGVKRKSSKYYNTFFLITESDVWKINSDQVNHYPNSFLNQKKWLNYVGNSINQVVISSASGFFVQKNSFEMVFQKTNPIFLSSGSILNYNHGDIILENEFLGNLVNYNQQTEDIVQGLPKIEELIEARKPRIKSYLSPKPGVIIDSNYFFSKITGEKQGKRSELIYSNFYSTKIQKKEDFKNKLKKDKYNIQILQNFFWKNDLILLGKMIVNIWPIPSIFFPTKKKIKKNIYYLFETSDQKSFLLNNKIKYSYWEIGALLPSENALYTFKNGLKELWANLKPNTLYINWKLPDYIICETITNQYLLIQYLKPSEFREIPLTLNLISKFGNFLDLGEPFTEGQIDFQELLSIFSKYHSKFDGMFKGTFRSLNKFQLLLVNSIQSIYQSQNVTISSKHLEIIVRQMTAKVLILDSGDTPLLPGELFRLSFVAEIYLAFEEAKNKKKYKTPKYEPFLLSATNSSLNKEGFLSPAGFQETKRLLTKGAIEGTSDWIQGLKECVIIGRLIPAGSSFLNYKNYLDSVHLFKHL